MHGVAPVHRVDKLCQIWLR